MILLCLSILIGFFWGNNVAGFGDCSQIHELDVILPFCTYNDKHWKEKKNLGCNAQEVTHNSLMGATAGGLTVMSNEHSILLSSLFHTHDNKIFEEKEELWSLPCLSAQVALGSTVLVALYLWSNLSMGFEK